MNDQRPYRPPGTANPDLWRIKVCAALAVILGILVVSEVATQRTATILGGPRVLGPGLFTLGFRHTVYPPWQWIVWAWRFRSLAGLAGVWEDCLRTTGYPAALMSIAAAGFVHFGRRNTGALSSDLHGSARWATTEDLREAGLIQIRRKRYALGRLAERLGIARPQASLPGVCLGIWRDRRHEYLLRDTSSSHVLAFAPTRSGKGVGIVIPTLLTWPHSALIHDIKGENWALTAGRRASMGQVCLKFDPTDPSGASVRYNPLDQIRLRTPYEAEDTQNVVQMIVDPNGRGVNSHWLKTGAAMLTGTILHVLYSEQAKTLRGLVGVLADPRVTLTDTLNRMMTTEHDPDGSMGWTDYRGQPTRTHPIVAESMREVLSKSDDERSSVYSTATSFFALYRDPIIAANTETSEFQIQDLMNHERPVSLYIVVPLASKDRLRPLIRLLLNQVVRTLTTTMKYANGRAVASYKHRLLLMIDEFPTLGPLDVFHEALSLVAGYGIKACLIAQDLSQIHATYGHDESITSNCHTRVAFTPNRIETAKLLSMMAGETTVRRTQVTVSGRSSSVSEPESPRPLLTSDEAMRLPKDTALIFTTGHPAIWARKLRYYQHATMEGWAKIPPPEISDHIIEGNSPRIAITPKTAPETPSATPMPDWLENSDRPDQGPSSADKAKTPAAKADEPRLEKANEPTLLPAQKKLRLL